MEWLEISDVKQNVPRWGKPMWEHVKHEDSIMTTYQNPIMLEESRTGQNIRDDVTQTRNHG